MPVAASLRRVFLEPPLPSPDEVRSLGEAERAHLVRVLRATAGQAVLLFDGQGHQAEATLEDPPTGRVRVTGPVHEAAATWPVHALLGLTKGQAMDHAVRMVVEAGATHLHPVLCQRSVARGGRHDRWERIARSAATQCGRADVPQVLPLAPLAEVLTSLPGVELRIALPGTTALGPANGPSGVLIGPEGGLTPAEVAASLDAGLHPTGLGPWVLRADTAAAVAIAQLTAR